MTVAASEFGVYVHIPFCRMLCTYCDFVKYRGLQHWYTRYADAVVREAATWQQQFQERAGVSLFFGGGTPSVLGLPALLGLRRQLAGAFGLDGHAEYCLEANPEDISEAFADAVSGGGFTRVSVGLQTFDDALLRRLGRLHSGGQGKVAVRRLLAGGVCSVGGDLIFGLPGQTLAHWQETLERAIELGLQHLSCYALTVEPATPLGRQAGRGLLTLPHDDATADMYDHAATRLAAAGYDHYEVSNWCLPGHESRHNSLYWHGSDYVGLGAGAVGCVHDRRWWNQRRVEQYCLAVEGGKRGAVEEEFLTPLQRAEELLLLGLRTSAGLTQARFYDALGLSLEQALGHALADALSDGLVVLTAGALRVPEQRWGVLHSIVARLLAGLDVTRMADAAPPAPQANSGRLPAVPATSC